jgi:hypothetical protein
MIHIADIPNASPTVDKAGRRTSLPLAPLERGVKAKPNTPERVKRDLRTLATFVDVYCLAKHPLRPRVCMKDVDPQNLAGKPVFLCEECTRLLQHSMVKRTHCPRDPKPDCKHCPSHCYAPKYRAQLREVMKFSGKRLLLRGRLDYLWHLFF